MNRYIKITKDGLGKKTLNYWKLEKHCHRFNIFGTAFFITDCKTEPQKGKKNDN